MKKLATALLALTVLGACTAAEITTPPVNIVPNSPSKAVGLDVYARDRARGNPVPAFRGQKTVQVRARGKGSDGGNVELSGVPCTLDSGVYKAKFVTPANVVVPDYGSNSPALFVRCIKGEESGSATFAAYNLTHANRTAGAAGTGILGAIIVGAVAAAKRDDAKDDFAYPPVTITLK